MRVKGYGPVFGSSGYSVHTRNFFEALSNYCDLGLIPELENVFGTKLSDRAKLLLANGRLMQRRDIAINISHGNRMQSFCGEPMIGYTVFESSRIPNSWVHQHLE